MRPELDIASLIASCLQGDSVVAWREFVARTHPLIASVILRVVRRYGWPDISLVDDLIQETYLRLCRNDYKALRNFRERHEEAIFGFLKVVAASVATDHFRSVNAQKRLADKHPEQSDLIDSIVSVPSNAEQATMVGEIDRCIGQVSANSRDKTVFWLYYQHGYTARDIALLPEIGLSAKGVESCIYRLTQSVRNLIAKPFPANLPAREGKAPSPTLGELG